MFQSRTNTPRISDKELFTMIQKRAYDFYAKRGCKPGKDKEDWLRAEREVKRELGLI
jgi:hypothetical protein